MKKIFYFQKMIVRTYATCLFNAIIILLAPVAQWIEHRIPNPGVAGSIPAGRA